MKFPVKLSAHFCALYILSSGISALADEVIIDNLIVEGSLCVGETCIIDQEFSFDTIQIKGTNPQIKFEDTSSSAAFPSSDWAMRVDSSDPEAPSVFSIRELYSEVPILQLGSGTNGGVALGAGAELIEGAISFGSEAQLRRVTFVADGIDASDAITKQQLDVEIAQVSQRIQVIINRLDQL